MVVCKFFLQGTCKFGNMCKFQHDVNESYNPFQSGGTSVLRTSNFNQPKFAQPAQEKPAVDTNMLVKSVVSDMTQAEKGGQWLFSCYAPYKEKPIFPGFEDLSFEELRFAYYEAVKTNTVEQYKQQIQGKVQEVLIKVRSLQNPSPDIINMLVNIYNTPPSSQAGTFTGNTQTNVTSNFSFNSGGINQQNTTTLFNQPNQSIFGNTQQNAFNNQANNVFGGSNVNNQNTQNIFANQQSNVFGKVPPAPTGSIFNQANNNMSAQSNSIFNTQPVPSQTNTGSIFTNNQPAHSGNIFANANQNQPAPQAQNIFGAAQPVAASFAPPNNQFVQPTQNPQTPMFNQPPANDQPQGFNNNIFRNQQNPAPATLPKQVDSSIYSKLEDLSEGDIKWFQSDDLDISNIPEKPPTYEMCFKI
ncbi:unnamed protein product [Phyllotreta striolata]|uniref:Nucleoporin NUP42 n=1 Tax=Phyllotreta striolata TaxID=444603 RepID=A0A9N9TYJ6_PHYSR|nr:unnamed protein product [Phyllotreta striolata]